MAKFNMKDYEMAMLEEERQDRLQEELENRREKESWEAEANWWDYQRKQEEERLREEFNRYPEYDGYFDEDDFDDDDCYPEGEYDPDCNSDPDEFQDSEDAELFDPWYEHIYDYGFQKYDCFDEQDLLDADVPDCDMDESLDRLQIEKELDLMEAELYYLEVEKPLDELKLAGDYDSHFWLSDGWYHDTDELYFENLYEEEKDFEELRRVRKAASRNRHLNEIKAKRRAQQSANILASKYRNSTVGTDYEEFRLYSRSSAAKKKAARVKTA